MITSLPEQLRRDEGEVLHVYPDKYGYLTIGVGRLIDPRKGGRISQAESSLLLTNDITRIEQALNAGLSGFAKIDPIRRAVITNLAFNVGVEGALKFQATLTAIRAGRWPEAAAHLLDSKAAKIDAPARYKRLAQQLITGEWQ